MDKNENSKRENLFLNNYNNSEFFSLTSKQLAKFVSEWLNASCMQAVLRRILINNPAFHENHDLIN